MSGAESSSLRLRRLGVDVAPRSRLATLIALLSTLASAQESSLMWFPLKMDTRWLYDHEAKSGQRSRPDVDHWTTSSTRPASMARVIAPNGEIHYVPQQGDPHGYLTSRDRSRTSFMGIIYT